MNPIGIAPIFVALTDAHSRTEQRSTIRKAIVIAFIILVSFLLLGRAILALFGITLGAFQIAGGIIIFGIAYQLVQAKPSHVNTLRDKESQEFASINDVAVTPLATPLLAGPGSIATVMALSSGPNPLVVDTVIIIALVGVLILTYIIFRFSPWITSHLRQTEINTITRMMGLILAVIAVQMAVTGIRALFPHLS